MIYTSPDCKAIDGIRFALFLNGERVSPDRSFLGTNLRGTFEIVVEVSGALENVSVYTLALQSVSDEAGTGRKLVPQPKAIARKLPVGFERQFTTVLKPNPANVGGLFDEIDSRVYIKRITVAVLSDELGVGLFPANTIGVRVGEDVYTIGVHVQGKRFFFAIEKMAEIVPTEDTPVGTVLKYSPLKGIAIVHSGERLFPYKIHWRQMPRIAVLHDCQVLPVGYIVSWNEADLFEPLSTVSSFRREIMKLTSAKPTNK